MQHGRQNLTLRVVLRVLLYALLISSALVLSAPGKQAGATPEASRRRISFDGRNDVGVAGYVNRVALGDLDNDGDLDVVCGAGAGPNDDYEMMAWENGGFPFTDPWSRTGIGATGVSVLSVALGDLDNDGDLDIASGQGSVGAWKNDNSPFTDLWPQNYVGGSSVYSVGLGDLDNDGDLDIVSGSLENENSKLVAWENDGSPFVDPWSQNIVGGSTDDVMSVALADLDDDGDLDIVSGSRWDEDYEVIAWENDGSPFSDLWSQTDVGSTTGYIVAIAAGDLDRDGDLDVVSRSASGPGYEIIAWENDGSPFGELWPRNDAGLKSTYDYWALALGDLDDDGDLDIVASNSTWNNVRTVIALENDGSPFSGLWREMNLGWSSDHVRSVAAGDLDQDGDLDLVSGSGPGEDYEVIAWMNASPLVFHVPCVAMNHPLGFCDDFSIPTSGWFVADSGGAKRSYSDGEYEILVRNPYYGAASAAPISGFVRYSVEADMRHHRGRSLAYGLIFGLVDWDHFYLFLVDPFYQHYSVWKRDSTWVRLRQWTYNSHINPGVTTNHLKAERGEGAKIYLYINDEGLPLIGDRTYTGAVGMGLFAQSYYDTPAAVRFDNFCATELYAGAAEGDVAALNEIEMPAGTALEAPPAD